MPEKAFEEAELAKLNSVQWESYESSLKEYRDIKGYIDTAFNEEKMEGKIEIALKKDDIERLFKK